MCGSLSSLNPLSSCKGPRLENDVESFIVMPGELNFTEKVLSFIFKLYELKCFLGCTLEVWDEGDWMLFICTSCEMQSEE